MPRTNAERRELTVRRREAGLCTRRGCEKPDDGYAHCPACREITNKLKKEQRIRDGGNSPAVKRWRAKIHDERRAAGLCACGRESRPGYALCKKCANRFKLQQRRYRQRKKVEWMLEGIR